MAPFVRVLLIGVLADACFEQLLGRAAAEALLIGCAPWLVLFCLARVMHVHVFGAALG
jgi:hypothetical protein